MDYNLNIKLKMIKLLEENASFLTLVSAMIFFLHFPPKAEVTKLKIKKWDKLLNIRPLHSKGIC